MLHTIHHLCPLSVDSLIKNWIARLLPLIFDDSFQLSPPRRVIWLMLMCLYESIFATYLSIMLILTLLKTIKPLLTTRFPK